MTDMLPNLLKNRAYLTPNREAIVYRNQRLSFRELYERAYQHAGILAGYGVNEFEYVGFLVKSDIETVIHLLALQVIGAKAVLLNNRLTSSELIYQINDAKVKFLITEQEFEEKGKSIEEEISITVIDKGKLDHSKYIQPMEIEQIDLNKVCSIMYTSGTTGAPKGVIQTYGNHWWSAVGNALNAGLTEEDTWLCTVPLFHISGYSILMRSLIYGIKIVLHEHFDENRILDDIQMEKVTIMSVVTTMLQRIEGISEAEFPQYFRYMLLGGGPVSVELLTRCMKKGIPVYYSYGMTETSSQIVTLSPDDSLKKIGSAGKPLFPAQLKIIGETGEEVSADEVGEIHVYGPNVSKGYLNRESHLQSGWFCTGDIGYKDSEGFLYVLDRRADLIISGGENVYPAEIEAVLSEMNGIKEAAVIGISNKEWGQVPVAFIVKETSSSITKEDISKSCEYYLAKFKIPKQIYFIPEIPRNAAGKIVRRTLREWVKDNLD